MNFALTLESWKVEHKYETKKEIRSDINVDFGINE